MPRKTEISSKDDDIVLPERNFGVRVLTGVKEVKYLDAWFHFHIGLRVTVKFRLHV